MGATKRPDAARLVQKTVSASGAVTAHAIQPSVVPAGTGVLWAISCPSVTVCYVTGYLHRLMRSADGGTTWRDLNPAIFFSGTYSARPRLHTYSPWFAATSPWQVTVGVWDSNTPGCSGGPGVPIFVQNTAKQRVIGPIHPSGPGAIGEYSRTVRVMGRLRLDVVSPHCTEFSVRIDGVKEARSRAGLRRSLTAAARRSRA